MKTKHKVEYKIIKHCLLNHLIEQIDQNIEAAKQSITSAKESRDSDTKSSAGDKYETGRTMMQFELEKNEVQLNKYLHLKNELSKIDINKLNLKAEFGSIVISNRGNYFLSIGIGKIQMENEIYFALSLASPIGKLLHEKKTGDAVLFQGKQIEITAIY